MLDKIIALDKRLLIFLNTLGSEKWDGLWLIITKQIYWLPFFIFLGYLLYKKTTKKNFYILVLFIATILLICNTSVEFFKVTFHRLRPCNDPSIKNLIRVVHQSDSFSFISGHATNSMATMTFLYFILKKHYNYAFLVFLYPLIFAYSRIYLGVHYPIDILAGYLFGAISGFGFYKIYERFLKN